MAEQCFGTECGYLQNWAEDKGRVITEEAVGKLTISLCEGMRNRGELFASDCPRVGTTPNTTELEVQHA